MRDTLTRQMANFAAGLTFEQLPAEVLTAAKQSILDWLGVAYAGSQEPVAGVVCSLLDTSGSGSGASVLGWPGTTSPMLAALANGTIGHAIDFDDTHLAARLHTSAVVLPAVLAIVDAHNLSGRDLLTAYVAGFECGAALGQAAGSEHYDAGWHMTGTIGTFAAAIAASRALGLDAEALSRAISLAATQSSGLQRVFGSMAKPFNAGRAAMSGVLAAQLAERGMTAPDDAIEGPRGLFALNAANPSVAGWPGVGEGRWNLPSNTVKLHACCHALHSSIEAALKVRPRVAAELDEIESVRVDGWPVTTNIAGIKEPTSGYEGKFSIYHAVAAALIDGTAGPGEFTEDKLADQRIRGLARRVGFEPDPNLDINQAVVTITLADGRHIQEVSNAVAGQVGDDRVWPALERKFRELAEPVIGAPAAQQTIERMKTLESIERVAPIREFANNLANSQRG